MIFMDEDKYPRLAERLKEPVPNGRIEWARDFAMDLAVGFNEGAWGNKLYFGGRWDILLVKDQIQNKILEEKWADLDFSDRGNLVEQGFLHEEQDYHYQLTVKATDLALTPTISPTVFISYKHGTDARLVLLIASEIKSFTNAVPFHDESLRKQITPEIKEEIERASALVCILGKDTMIRESGVRFELEFAREKNKQIEFLWQNDYKHGPIDDQPDELKAWVDDQLAVTIGKENTKGYNTALNELIDKLCTSAYISKRL